MWSRAGTLLLLLLLVSHAYGAASPKLYRFDIPAGDAVTTLKRAAQQAGVQIAYSALVVRGVKTQTVVGEYTARGAFERMLVGTPLRIFEDPVTGALSITRQPDPPATAPPAPKAEPVREISSTMKRKNPLALLGLWLVPSLLGQTAPTAADVKNEETITLSPFVISTDREAGWSANETLSANRTKQALKDVPVSIDALTSDFLEDLNLFSADEAANFVANVYAAPIMENDNQTDNFAFRGLSQRNTVSRNYFRWYIPADTYNVERIDFGKGSNSLIFGEIEPGGQGAVFTKRAMMKNFGTISGVYNSEGAYRMMLDYNRKLRNGLAIRVNGLNRLERTFQDASDFKLRAASVALTWQPFRNTLIRAEVEQGNFDAVRGFSGVSIREQSATGRSFGNAGWFYTSDDQWINRGALPTIDRGGSAGPAGGSPTLLEDGYFDVVMRSATGAVVGTKRVYGYPKEYNLRGSFDRNGRPFDTYTITLEQRLGPIGVEVAYNHQNSHQVRTDNFFSSVLTVDVNGRIFTDSSLDRKRIGNQVDAFRGTAIYKWDKLSWMQQMFVVSGEYSEDAAEVYRWQVYNVDAVDAGRASSINLSNDRIRVRAYFDDPAFYSRSFFDRLQATTLPDGTGVKPRLIGLFDGSSPTNGTEWRQNYATSASASGRYLKGRVQTLVGARRDYGRVYAYTGTRTFGPYKEAMFAPKRQDAMPGEYVENMNLHLNNTSLSGGVTVALTKDINLYGTYAESFRFQDAYTFDRERFGPITGVTKEVGLKGNLFDDRLTVSLGVFNIDRQNVVRTWSGVYDFTKEEIEDLMNPNDIPPGDPRYKYAMDGTASASRNYRSTENSKGYDFTIFARPLQGLQVRFTFGYANVRGIPELGSLRKYYEAAVSRGNENAALLTEVKTVLDSLDLPNKPTGARAAPYSASWVVDYGFPRAVWSPLRGVRLGANGSWRDNYLFGIANGQELSGGASHLVNAYVMRDQKIWGQQVRIRAGVKNLVDLENGNTRKTSFTTLSSGANVYRFSYVMPPQYDLTVTVRF